MAEIHLSGQIAEATGFPGNNLFCEVCQQAWSARASV